MIGDIIFIVVAVLAFLFLPMIIGKFSQRFLKRHVKYGNPISENFKDDRIQEEMVTGKALLEGILRNG